MSSTFGGINTALTSLYAQRRGLDVTGQNIANANTEGYTRQRVEMQGQPGAIVAAYWSKSDGMGTGVAVSDVLRLRDEYLESRGREEHSRSSYLANQVTVYSQIEDVFSEPKDTALQAQLHDMWGAWGDVANNPQDSAARSALLQQSGTVVDGLNDAYDSLAGQWSTARAQLAVYEQEVNTAAAAVAKLNHSIVQATAAGVTVNELQDQRDVHVMRLAELVGASAAKRDNGALDVFVGGSPLVAEFTTRAITVSGTATLAGQRTDPLDPLADPVRVRWADTSTAAPPGGTMGSVVDQLTAIIPGMADAIDEVAAKLANTVNAKHAAGFGLDGSTGRAFFTGTTAQDLRVAITSASHIAAASGTEISAETGLVVGKLDGSVADTLAASGTAGAGPDKAYQDMIARLGVAAQTVGRQSDIQAHVTEQVDAARQSESGVNLDEEMTSLIKYQRGYEAASRVLTTIDSMLDQLINRTGLVGR